MAKKHIFGLAIFANLADVNLDPEKLGLIRFFDMAIISLYAYNASPSALTIKFDKKVFMAPRGIEPMTFALLARRSNQLS